MFEFFNFYVNSRTWTLNTNLKKNIISNALSKLVNFNIFPALPSNYDEFEIFYHEIFFEVNFTTILVQMNPNLKKRILKNYRKNSWWNKLLLQIQQNEIHGANAANISFVFGKTLPPTNSNFYFHFISFDSFELIRPENVEKPPATIQFENVENLVSNNNSDFSTIIRFENVGKFVQNNSDLINNGVFNINEPDLFYHINKITGIHKLCIFPKWFSKFFKIIHSDGHPDFKNLICKKFNQKFKKNIFVTVQNVSFCKFENINFTIHCNSFQYFQFFIMLFQSILF